MSDVQHLTEEQEYYIRTWWLMELSIKVMWEFVAQKGWTEDSLKKLWKGVQGNFWKHKTIREKDPKEWDIGITHEAIQKIKQELTQSELDALDGLKDTRNENFGHVSRGVNKATYENMVEEVKKHFRQLVDTNKQKEIDDISSGEIVDKETWKKKLKVMEDRLNKCQQKLYEDVWLHPLGEWMEQREKEAVEEATTMIAIRKLGNGQRIHPTTVPGILKNLPGILGDLFPLTVCEKWEAFGRHFGITDEEMSEIQQKEGCGGFGKREEFLMHSVVVLILSHEGMLIFSKENIYNALMTICDLACAEEFEKEYYQPEKK